MVAATHKLHRVHKLHKLHRVHKLAARFEQQSPAGIDRLAENKISSNSKILLFAICIDSFCAK